MLSDLPDLLAQFDAQLTSQFPAVAQSLRPGASTSDLNAFEREHGMILPEAFRQLYLWRDGQDAAAPTLFGDLEFWPLAQVRRYMADWRDDSVMEDLAEEDDEHLSYPPGYIRTSYLRLGWIPFADSPAAQSLCFDLDPASRGASGQIISWEADEPSRYVLAESLEAFVTTLLERFAQGRVSVVGADTGMRGTLSFNGQGEDVLDLGLSSTLAGIGALPET